MSAINTSEGKNPEIARTLSLVGQQEQLRLFEAQIASEARIISRMCERIGLKVILDVSTYPEYQGKIYIPILEKPPEEQDWDISITYGHNCYGHTGAMYLSFGYIEESDLRWIGYDQAYEEMFKDMAKTVDAKAQEEKIRQMVKYIYEQAYQIFIYSPISLYPVNKEVNFVPQKFNYLRLKETSVTDKRWSVRGEKK